MMWIALVTATLVLTMTSSSGHNVSLTPYSTVYIPHDYSKPDTYMADPNAVKKAVYDPENQIAYAIGDRFLHVINISDPLNMEVLQPLELSHPGNDVIICRQFVICAVSRDPVTENGGLVIYTKATQEDPTLHPVNIQPAGPSPWSIAATSSCETIIVANAGRGGKGPDGEFVDPEGSVTILRYPGGNLHADAARVQTIDFQEYNSRAEELNQQGIRFVFRGPNRDFTFAQSLQPEQVILSSNERKAYINLQVNNAVAIIDVSTGRIDRLKGLGYKWWGDSRLDPSDSDNGIHIEPWPVHGMYQPGQIKYFFMEGRPYLASANEGSFVDYEQSRHALDWTEEVRARNIIPDLSPRLPKEVALALKNNSHLGRLKISTQTGFNISTHKFDGVYSFGARSFSLWRADDISQFYDSGDDIEQRHADHFPAIFNMYVSSEANSTAEETFDRRSDDRGVEPKLIDVAFVDGVHYIFLANERASTLMIYSMGEDGTSTPRFRSIFHAGNTDKSWMSLYKQKLTGDLYPGSLQFLPADISPLGKPALLVCGTLSRTVSLYEVHLPIRSREASLGNSADDIYQINKLWMCLWSMTTVLFLVLHS